MVTWTEFEAAAPELAAEGRRLIYARGDGEALLASVRGDDLPRIHPINVGVVDGHLYAFVIVKSAKLADLEQDGRYAMHTHVDPARPSEFSIRGRARLIYTQALRTAVGEQWYFQIDGSYALFEFSIDSALLGVRPTAADWPPRYTRWVSPEVAPA